VSASQQFASEQVPGTKVVATLGGNSSSTEAIGALVDAGMTVARVDISHSPVQDSLSKLEALKDAVHHRRKLVATLLDTRGPELQVANVGPGCDPITLNEGKDDPLLAFSAECLMRRMPFWDQGRR